MRVTSDKWDQYRDFCSKLGQPALRSLTVVVHVFVDIVLSREDLAHGGEKGLQSKRTSQT